MRLGLPVLILAIAVGGFFWLRTTRPALPPAEVAEKAWRVSVQTVTPGRQVPNLLLYGTVEAPREAELRAAVAAEVIAVKAAEGEPVVAGQLLARLDERDIVLSERQRAADVAEIQALIDSERQRYQSDLAALEREKTMLALDQKAVDRAADLSRRKVGSESLLDEARLTLQRQALSLNARQLAVDDHPARLAQLQARLARAEALLDQARLDRERTRVESPVSGRITQVPIAPGDRVRVGDLLVELYADDELEIRAQIPYRYLPAVRAALERGETLTATSVVDSQSVTAELARLSGEAARAAGGVDALFRITQGAQGVVPGRLSPLLLALPAQPQTVALPATALYGLDRIYRLEEGRMAGLTVERVGERRAPDGTTQVLVRSPALQAGDRIITTQLPNAVTGLKVTLAEVSADLPL